MVGKFCGGASYRAVDLDFNANGSMACVESVVFKQKHTENEVTY